MQRISTFRHFENQAQQISTQFQQMDKLQAQVESDKNIQNSSDDPVLAAQIKSNQEYINELNNFKNNGSLAQAHGKLFDTTMSSVVQQITQAANLIQQAQSGTNLTVRSDVAAQLQGVLNGLLSLANTQGVNGNYIFAGYNTTATPYVQTASGFQYQGGLDPISINIAPGVSTLYYESGFSVFGNIPQGNGAFTVGASTTNTGTALTSAGNVVNQSAYVADTYTLRFVTNAGGQLAYQVVGSSSGQVIPTPPATTPANAPAYQSGNDIIFNGISINVTGNPVAGDTFTIQPSQKQDIFTTIQNTINLLQNSSNNQAYVDQGLSQSGASVSQAVSHLITYQTQVGTRNALTNTQVTANSKTAHDQQAILSDLENADLAKVYSTLVQQSLALQATQAGYLKIQQTLGELLKLS